MTEEQLVLRPKFWVILLLLFSPICFFFTGLLVVLLVTSPPDTAVDLISVCFGSVAFLWGGLYAYFFSLKRVSRIVIDKRVHHLEFKTLLGRPIGFNVDEIIGYSACRTPALWSRLPEDGVVLYLRSNEVIELSDASLRSLDQLASYLTEQRTPYLGEERSWYPFMKKSYKFSL